MAAAITPGSIASTTAFRCRLRALSSCTIMQAYSPDHLPEAKMEEYCLPMLP